MTTPEPSAHYPTSEMWNAFENAANERISFTLFEKGFLAALAASPENRPDYPMPPPYHIVDANKKVSIDLSYLRELEDHLNRFDGLQKAAEVVYDEFQKKIAHGDNGAELLEALHRLHVELHR